MLDTQGDFQWQNGFIQPDEMDKSHNDEAGLFCPQCNLPVKKEAVYCPHCGALINNSNSIVQPNEPEEPPQEKEILCPSCGQPIKEDTIYCPHCGRPRAKTPAKDNTDNDPPTKPRESSPRLILLVAAALAIVALIVAGIFLIIPLSLLFPPLNLNYYKQIISHHLPILEAGCVI